MGNYDIIKTCISLKDSIAFDEEIKFLFNLNHLAYSPITAILTRDNGALKLSPAISFSSVTSSHSGFLFRHIYSIRSAPRTPDFEHQLPSLSL